MDHPLKAEFHEKKQRRKFDTTLKLEVVRMAREQGLSVKQVSDITDIGETGLRRWLKQHDAGQSRKMVFLVRCSW
ncbi:transposase [Actimicrobium antarcticum]|uniref:transposase n=1 Tax=Actimicrobium antarcticum TaxID=1051899 RepID=UPI0031DC657C